jgi:hypothetical protein
MGSVVDSKCVPLGPNLGMPRHIPKGLHGSCRSVQDNRKATEVKLLLMVYEVKLAEDEV